MDVGDLGGVLSNRFIKLSVEPFSRHSYLQLSAVLRMREYSHTNVRYRDSNSGTGIGTLATALILKQTRCNSFCYNNFCNPRKSSNYTLVQNECISHIIIV